MRKKNTSPYTKNKGRLPDVISAIQVMGTYKFYKLEIAKWAERIRGQDASTEHWRKVFTDHPEFFRVDKTGDKASLVWRRAKPKIFNVDTGVNISKSKYDELGVEHKKRISRTPLSPEDIASLISTAISLHSREIEHNKEKKKLGPFLMAVVPPLIGVLIGFFGAYHMESTKQEAKLKSEVLSEFAKAFWVEPGNIEAQNRYIVMKNKLAVIAPNDVIQKLADYHSSECFRMKDDETLPDKCKEKWSAVVNSMRRALGEDSVDKQLIENMIWGNE